MFRNVLVIGSSLGLAAALAAADGAASAPSLSAAQIVEKNVAVRGGLDAWRAVKTMSLTGKLGAGGNQRASLQAPASAPTQVVGRKGGPSMLPTRPTEEVQLPFLMELARPRKMRFELQFNGQTAVQVFDGASGWKLRPFLGRRVVEPYTADELKTSSMQADLDGPLVDYAAKGTALELAGTEKVEGRDTYKIKMTMKNGQALHVWIDALTLLEAKIEGQPRRLDGTLHPVEIYFHDFRSVSGLQIPFALETKVVTVAKNAFGLKDPPVPPEKIIVDKVAINPKFDEAAFSKPDAGLTASVVQ
jgi:hypothetical protein